MIGPKDHWQHALSSVSKRGLIDACEELIYVGQIDRDLALRIAKRARTTGRMLDSIARHSLFQADPDGFVDTVIRRRKSAQKAARRRKRETKQKKGKA